MFCPLYGQVYCLNKKMKRVILWTTPRSLSTAFYRCMTAMTGTRTKCLFELFCMPYYFGPPSVRLSSRYEIIEDKATADMVCEPTYDAVKVSTKMYTRYYGQINKSLNTSTAQAVSHSSVRRLTNHVYICILISFMFV